MRNPKPLPLLPTTFQLGFKLNKLEIIFEFRESVIGFARPDSGHATIDTHGTILFGLGIVF